VLRTRYPSSKVYCIRNGIDLARVVPTAGRSAARERLGIAGDAFVVGGVGRLMPIKGFEHLIEAFARLRQQQPPAASRLLIVGDGPLRESLAQCAQRHRVSRDVTLLGARADVHDVMTALDVFALSSLHEGMPMVILEAMALGVPIVATRVGGIPEILEDGKDAVLVPPGDAQALANAIESLAASPERRDAGVRSARRRVEVECSIGATAAAVHGLYRSLGARQGP
jgi:glycosyltransferase involved in cell wall biosynthesis